MMLMAGFHVGVAQFCILVAINRSMISSQASSGGGARVQLAPMLPTQDKPLRFDPSVGVRTCAEATLGQW